jgi:hypothetical protein
MAADFADAKVFNDSACFSQKLSVTIQTGLCRFSIRGSWEGWDKKQMDWGEDVSGGVTLSSSMSDDPKTRVNKSEWSLTSFGNVTMLWVLKN